MQASKLRQQKPSQLFYCSSILSQLNTFCELIQHDLKILLRSPTRHSSPPHLHRFGHCCYHLSKCVMATTMAQPMKPIRHQVTTSGLFTMLCHVNRVNVNIHVTGRDLRLYNIILHHTPARPGRMDSKDESKPAQEWIKMRE